MTTAALEVRGLTRRYGGKAVVQDLDLRVEPGDLYGFLGPNGAGKTTTMRMILGLIARDAGSVSIFGESDPTRGRSRLGGIVEGPRFWPYLSGRRNLEILARYGGADRGRIDGLLHAVRLADRADDPVRTYSLGMKQRLGIAQALLGEPSLLMLDEPTNGLDPAGQREMRDLIQALHQERNLTVFLSSHQLHEVDLLCTRVGIVLEGRKVAEGAPDELRRGDETLEDAFLRLTGGGGQIR